MAPNIGGYPVSRPAAARLAWSFCAVCFALTGVALVFSALDFGATDSATTDWTYDVIEVLLLAYPTVGALVASRYPKNPIGWIFCGVGVSFAVTNAAQGYAVHGLIAQPGSLPGAADMAWLSEWLFIPALILAATFLLLLFPTGKLPSRRWRPVAVVAGLGTLGISTLGALAPGPFTDAPFTSVANPLGVGALESVVGPAFAVLFLITLGCGLAAAISLVVRFRRATGVERVQLKWIAYAGALLVPLFIGTGAAPHRLQTLVQLSTLIAVATLPIATGIAILRYRLYEIDRIISRTLVYGALTVILGAAYAGLVLVGQALFSSVAGGSHLAVAASTLVVAALFLPARSRVQGFVDRRFYRSRYDAARTLEAFGARLRDQVKLEALKAELAAVVGETMQPAHAGVWLRETAP